MASSPLRLVDIAKKLKLAPRAKPLPLGISAIDAALPDEGLPAGSVIEICSPFGLGRVTHFALSACAAAQRDDRWAAWVDPLSSLYAPGLRATGVDLQRLLIVQPEPADIARIAVRLASSRLFKAIVIDRHGVPGATLCDRSRWRTAVRRLALAAESSESSILLLSSEAQAHRDLLPTAMRIELSCPRSDRLQIHITKDRRGRLSAPVTVPLRGSDAPDRRHRVA